MLIRRVLTLFLLCAATNAYAQSMAPHQLTGQIVPVQEMPCPTGIYEAWAHYAANVYPVITYGSQFLADPPLLQQFIRLHECAHLALPTSNEIAANCFALVNLRRQGLPSPAEAFIVNTTHAKGVLPPQYGGSSMAFWQLTLNCANGPNPY